MTQVMHGLGAMLQPGSRLPRYTRVLARQRYDRKHRSAKNKGRAQIELGGYRCCTDGGCLLVSVPEPAGSCRTRKTTTCRVCQPLL
jgi:hypothetical protein